MVYDNIKNLEQSGTVNPNPKGSNKALCFCVRDKIILYCFSRNNGQQFYVYILRRHLPDIDDLLRDEWRFNKTMT